MSPAGTFCICQSLLHNKTSQNGAAENSKHLFSSGVWADQVTALLQGELEVLPGLADTSGLCLGWHVPAPCASLSPAGKPGFQEIKQK